MFYLVNILALLLLTFLNTILSSNILYVAPTASPSHHIWNKAFAFGLVKKGHNVTMIAHETENETLPRNFTLITMEGLYDALYRGASGIQGHPEHNTFSMTHTTYKYMLLCCQHDLSTTGLQSLLDYPQDYKFDLIMFDNSLGTHCLYPLVERFHNPLVLVVTPFVFQPLLEGIFGGHVYTSYSPYYYTQYTDKMSLLERIINFGITYYDILYRQYVYMPREVTLIKKRFGNYKIPLSEVERNIGLLLCNADSVLDYPVALPPNIVPVGGLHIRPSSRLPQDIEIILDNAKEGAILFSLGTNVRSDQFDSITQKNLLDAFEKLPQVVIWKFETDNIGKLPKNVFIRKWLPQNDMLGHPNMKLFISHGGASSTQEAMYHCVPVVGIPFCVDQFANLRKMEDRKIAKTLDRKNLTSEIVYETINKVLNSHIYKKNVKEICRSYRNQPQNALERGIFWTEYLLRHGTVEHLVLPARDMPAYQINNIDVLAVFIFCVFLIYSFIMFLIKLCKFIFSRQIQ